MAVTAADIKAFAPELAGIADTILTIWIEDATSGAIRTSLFGVDADRAVRLYACHWSVKSSGGASGAVGPVTSRSVGDVTIQNASLFGGWDKAGLQTTAYGVALLQLMRRYTAGGVSV